MFVHFKKTERYSSYPVYHSVYETFEIVEKFYDPTFRRLQAVAQVRGGLIFLLADSQVLPLSASQYAVSLKKYAQSIAQLAQKHPQEMERFGVSFGEFITTKKYQLVFDFFIIYLPLSCSYCCPADFLFSALENFTLAATDFHKRLETINTAE